MVAPKSISLVQSMLLYFQIDLDTAPEKLMACRVRTQTLRKTCPVTMSDRVGATTGVRLASDMFLAFKLEALSWGRGATVHSVESELQGARGPPIRDHSFEGRADNTHECTGLVVGTLAQLAAMNALSQEHSHS